MSDEKYMVNPPWFCQMYMELQGVESSFSLRQFIYANLLWMVLGQKNTSVSDYPTDPISPPSIFLWQ